MWQSLSDLRSETNFVYILENTDAFMETNLYIKKYNL